MDTPTTATGPDAPPPVLRDALDWPDRALWQPMGGGRSNRIWKITCDHRDPLVCKLYSPTRGNDLFPNDPSAEILSLQTLAGSGLAPAFVSEIRTPHQRAVFYRYVAGDIGPGDPQAGAKVLSRLHRLDPPAALRSIPTGGRAIAKSGAEIAGRLRDGRKLPPMPDIQPDDPVAPVFLHGDPVPANMVRGQNGIVLIDWQCPGIGDACEDLFVFLSPAMQVLYGGAVLSDDQVEGCLAAYGGAAFTLRYQRLAPVLHWRMAAYCLWMAEQGVRDYRAAADLEIARLGLLEGRAPTSVKRPI